MTPGDIARSNLNSSRVDPNWLRQVVMQNVQQKGLAGVVPRDGAKYGITTGAPDQWADFAVNLVRQESGFDNNNVGDVGHFGTGSRGLFQLSQGDARNYGLNGGRPFSLQQLSDPLTNTSAAISIMKNLIDKTGSIRQGIGQYWGPVQRGWTPGNNVSQARAQYRPQAQAQPQMIPGQPQAQSQMPQAVDPATLQWAMQDTPNASLGAVFAPSRSLASPDDQRSAVSGAVAPVQMPGLAQLPTAQQLTPGMSFMMDPNMIASSGIDDPMVAAMLGQIGQSRG